MKESTNWTLEYSMLFSVHAMQTPENRIVLMLLSLSSYGLLAQPRPSQPFPKHL